MQELQQSPVRARSLGSPKMFMDTALSLLIMLLMVLLCYASFVLRKVQQSHQQEKQKLLLLRQHDRVGRLKAEQDLQAALTTQLLAPSSDVIRCQFIGRFKSPYRHCIGTPRQGKFTPATRGYIQFSSTICPSSFSTLEEFSHIWLIFNFHLNNNNATDQSCKPTFRAKVCPPRLKERVGLFSTRTPHRPNPVGMSLVKLDRIDIKKKRIWCSGIDLVNDTPVLDIKPYVPHYDHISNDDGKSCSVARWIDQSINIRRTVQWSPQSLAECEKLMHHSNFYGSDEAEVQAFQHSIEQVLAVDVRSVIKMKYQDCLDQFLVFDHVRIIYRVVENDRMVMIQAIEIHRT